jgi:hypothetical protein
MVTIGGAACVLALVVGGRSIAQQQGGADPQGGGPGGFGGGPGGLAQFRQMMMQQMKERLGADDQAWKVIEPRLTKVMDLNRQVSSLRGMLGMFGGGPGGPGGGPVVVRGSGPGASAALENAMAQARAALANSGGMRDAGPQGVPTALDKATAQLRTTLDNQSATPEDIKKQLTAVREAREKAKQELALAQADLTKILTVRQEAQLVLMGQLN